MSKIVIGEPSQLRETSQLGQSSQIQLEHTIQVQHEPANQLQIGQTNQGQPEQANLTTLLLQGNLYFQQNRMSIVIYSTLG